MVRGWAVRTRLMKKMNLMMMGATKANVWKVKAAALVTEDTPMRRRLMQRRVPACASADTCFNENCACTGHVGMEGRRLRE